MTCLTVSLRHQKILTQPAVPGIFFFADEHLYGVFVTGNFGTVPYSGSQHSTSGFNFYGSHRYEILIPL